MTVVIWVCGVACAVLVYAEARERAGLRLFAKVFASAAFVTVGLASYNFGSPASLGLLGLVLGALGDVALLGRDRRSFSLGLAAFLCGHLAYLVAIGLKLPPTDWIADAGVWIALPIVAGAAVLAWLWRRVGSLRGPITVYVVVSVALVIAAIALRCDHRVNLLARERIVAGAVLFFTSDIAVARERFVAPAFANKLVGLPLYYAAQVLLALGLSGM